MSASSTPAPTHDATVVATSRRNSQAALATSVIGSLSRSGKWDGWLSVESRLTGFANLEDVLAAWRRRDERCYQVVAGLTALGSRRGGDDDEAALAVVVLLGDGVLRVSRTLSDVCEVDDVNATVWEEVKAAEPQLGAHAARYLLQRSRQRLSRPAGGMVARVKATSLEQWLGWRRYEDQLGQLSEATSDRDATIAVPQVEDPVEDLADLLTWARGVGVVADEEVDLLVELLAVDNGGLPREEAQRAVGERHGVAMRTIRRRRDATVARLREAAPGYLAAIA